MSKMTDQDYATILLTHLKDLEKNMVVSLTEASNEKIYKKELEMFNNITTYQRKLYEEMFKKGWYKLEEAPKTKIFNEISSLNTKLKDCK